MQCEHADQTGMEVTESEPRAGGVSVCRVLFKSKIGHASSAVMQPRLLDWPLMPLHH